MRGELTRRHFLATSAAATLAAASPAAEPASNRARVGLIGCGGRGRELLDLVRAFPDVDVVAIADVIEPRLEQTAKVLASGPRPMKPDRVVEHERLLDRKDVDAVLIATTQHWHGRPFIQAAQAGKHVYVEKPLSLTVAEGRAMVEAAKRAGVVAMMGAQQRGYEHFLKAKDLVRSGRLGKVALVECWNYHYTGQRTGRAADGEPPAGTHWDRWLGPAPLVKYNPSRVNNSWWFDYGGGMMTNWAVHHIDTILWCLGAGSPTAVSSSGGKFAVDDLADTPDTQEALWEFPGWVMRYTYRGFNTFHHLPSRPNHHGIIFHGTKATLVLDRSGYELFEEGNMAKPVERASNPRRWQDGLPGNEVDGPWQRTFIDCVKNGKKPPADLEEGHRATVCCHLANIAYRTGHKFRWDGAKEQTPGDPAAAALLDRPRRQGYELPAV